MPRPELHLRSSKPRDVRRIAHRLRETDQCECAALGYAPSDALNLMLASSSWCETVVLDGEPQAMFGLILHDLVASIGRPWMLGTDELVRRARRELIRLAAEIVQRMLESVLSLEGLVGVENTPTIRWLTRLGFSVDAQPQFFGSEAMLHFERRR